MNLDDHESEPFDITVGRNVYTIVMDYDETYDVLLDGNKIGSIIPEHNDNGLYWTTEDLISQELVSELGEAIERHEM